MVIKRSSAPQVAALLHDLAQGNATAREAASARLAVIGTRAVEGVLAVLAAAVEPPVRAAAFAALEGIGDARGLEPALAAIADPEPEVAAAAAGVVRVFLESERGTEVLDRLTRQALDVDLPVGARLAAIEALRPVPARVTAPLWARLGHDGDPMVRAAAGGAPGEEGAAGASPEAGPVAALAAAAEGELPGPELLVRWLAAAGTETPLPVLHRLVEALRHREGAGGESARAAWMTARAAAHRAIAAHGSTVALYDLRETVEREDRVPPGMLTALARVGDRSCLEPLASAFARTAGADADSREALLAAFHEIAVRERVTPRSAEGRRIRARWPAESAVLLSPPRR